MGKGKEWRVWTESDLENRMRWERRFQLICIAHNKVEKRYGPFHPRSEAAFRAVETHFENRPGPTGASI